MFRTRKPKAESLLEIAALSPALAKRIAEPETASRYTPIQKTLCATVLFVQGMGIVQQVADVSSSEVQRELRRDAFLRKVKSK